MNYINLLCVSKKDNIGELLLLSIPIIFSILLIYGIILICEFYGKKDEKSISKLKRGTILFSISIVLVILSIFLMNQNVNYLMDSCGNRSALYKVGMAIFNIVKVIVPLIFIIKALYRLILQILSSKKEAKKELWQKVIRYIAIALSIFIIMSVIDILMGVFVDIPDSSGWVMCWCSD